MNSSAEKGIGTPPTYGNVKICYVELPATDERSAEFYRRIFGWHTRRRGDVRLAFDVGVGEVSGTWIVGRRPSIEPGLLLYIMVHSVENTMDTIVENGGEVVQAVGADAPEITARFLAPGGNIIGLYQPPAA